MGAVHINATRGAMGAPIGSKPQGRPHYSLLGSWIGTRVSESWSTIDICCFCGLPCVTKSSFVDQARCDSDGSSVDLTFTVSVQSIRADGGSIWLLTAEVYMCACPFDSSDRRHRWKIHSVRIHSALVALGYSCKPFTPVSMIITRNVWAGMHRDGSFAFRMCILHRSDSRVSMGAFAAVQKWHLRIFKLQVSSWKISKHLEHVVSSYREQSPHQRAYLDLISLHKVRCLDHSHTYRAYYRMSAECYF